MVQEDEDDEATEDGLVTKRTRVAPSSPPALPTPTPPSPPAPTPPVQATPLVVALPVVEGSEPNFIENPPSASTPFVSAGEGPPSTTSIAGAAPGGDEGAHNSPILITKLPLHHHAKKPPSLYQLKRVVVKVSTRLLQHLHQQQLQAFPPRSKRSGGPSQLN